MSKRKTMNYSEDFKESSAKLAATSEQAVSKTAKELGVNVNTLHSWVHKYYPNNNERKSSAASSELEEQIKRLRKENARLKQERDILKKATAYFASDQL